LKVLTHGSFFLMSVITLAVIKRVMHFSVEIYRPGFDWVGQSQERYRGTVIWGSPESRPLKYCLYRETFKSKSRLFVIIRGSTADSDLDWFADTGNFKCTEDNVPLGVNSFRIHHGFHASARLVWNDIEEQVLAHSGDVIFAGHSRGGSVAQLLHLIASNEHPDKNNSFWSIAFAPIPTSNSFDGVDEEHAFAIAVKNDPVPRLHGNVIKAYADAHGGWENATAAVMTYSYLDVPALLLQMKFAGLETQADGSMGLSQTWPHYREAYENQIINITKVFGRFYWLQENAGSALCTTWEDVNSHCFPTINLSASRRNYEELGNLTFLGLLEHMPKKYQHYIDLLPCQQGPVEVAPARRIVPQAPGDAPPPIPGPCSDERNWYCLFHNYGEAGLGYVASYRCPFVDNWICDPPSSTPVPDPDPIQCYDTYFDDPEPSPAPTCEPAEDLNTITIVFIALFAVAAVGAVGLGIGLIFTRKDAAVVSA
jgi:hypothetical protein